MYSQKNILRHLASHLFFDVPASSTGIRRDKPSASLFQTGFHGAFPDTVFPVRSGIPAFSDAQWPVQTFSGSDNRDPPLPRETGSAVPGDVSAIHLPRKFPSSTRPRQKIRPP